MPKEIAGAIGILMIGIIMSLMTFLFIKYTARPEKDDQLGKINNIKMIMFSAIMILGGIFIICRYYLF